MTSLDKIDVGYGALDTKTDERMLQPGALLVAENVSSQKVGVYSKRFGYSDVSLGANTMRLGAHDGQPILVGTRGRVYRLDTTWQQLTGLIGVGGNTALIADAQTSQTNVYLNQTSDITRGSRATTNDITVHAFIDGVNLIVRQERMSTGAFISESIVDFGGATFVHAVAAGNLVAVLYTHTTQVLNSVVVDTATGGVSVPVTILSGANVSAGFPVMDACPLNSTQVLVVWQSATPNLRVGLLTVSTSTFAAGPTVMSAEVPDGGVAIMGTTGEFGAILYHSTAAGGMRAACFNVATTAQTVAPFMVEAVVAPAGINCGLTRVDSTHLLAVWDRAATGLNKQKVQWGQISSAGVVGTLRGPLYNVALASKPFAGHSDYGTSMKAVNVWAPYNPQYTYFTVRLLLGAPVTYAPFCFASAMHAYRGAFKSAQVTGQLPDVDSISTNVYAFSAPISYKYLSTSVPRAGWSSFGIDYQSPTLFSNVEALGDTFFSAGLGCKVDGVTPTEINFPLYPEITAATPGAVGAAGMDNGTYGYILVYEYTDASGNTDRSTPSVAVSATTVAGAGLGKVTLQFDMLTIAQFGAGTPATSAPCNVSIFRTLANGTTYRHVASVALNASAANTTYVDQANDTTITSNRILYTDGGVLEREPPPASLKFVVHKNRVWGISSADRKTLFYSGQLSIGEAPWFSSLQQIRIDAGDDITGIASMDDKLVAFKSDRIFKIYGNGPNALGQNNDLSDPILVTGDAGCNDARATLATDTGVLFKSAKGLYELSRGEQVSYKGEAADAYWSGYADIVAANMLTDRQEARFEVSGGAGVGDALTGSAIASQKLVLNYLTGQWTTHRNYQDATAVDAIVVAGVYYWATSAGAVYKENTSSFLDPSSTYVRSLLRTGWLMPTGPQGFSRVGRAMHHGQRKTDHTLTLFVENDYVATTTTTRTWTAAELAALPQEQTAIHLKQQKGEAYRFTVYDGVGGTLGTGEGCTFLSIQLLAKPIRGTFEKMLSAGAKG
jgi:hypothetical protein